MTGKRPTAPPAVGWIVRTLEDAGHSTWAVGGAVRDALRGSPSEDWDFATQARPNQVLALFKRTVPVGIDHGTVGVLARDGTLYEVTTFRRDVVTDGRHAVVRFADRIEEDLARRDFTMNAIAWHPIRDELLDPFGGVADLEARVLRTVGAPEDRFSEDYLRILRALRFAGRLGLRIARETWDALVGGVDQLSDLSAERLREELLKILDLDPTPSVALSLYASSGALRALYPELDTLRSGAGREKTEWNRTLRCLDALPRGRPHLRLAALLRGIDRSQAVALLARLRLSNAQLDEATRRASAARLPWADANAETFRRWLSTVGPERLSALARIDLAKARTAGDADARKPADVVAAWRTAKAVRRSGAPLSVSDLAVTGRDLIRMGLRPGPDFGRILDALLDLTLAEPSANERGRLEAEIARLATDV